jgi:hypothetical protein
VYRHATIVFTLPWQWSPARHHTWAPSRTLATAVRLPCSTLQFDICHSTRDEVFLAELKGLLSAHADLPTFIGPGCPRRSPPRPHAATAIYTIRELPDLPDDLLTIPSNSTVLSNATIAKMPDEQRSLFRPIKGPNDAACWGVERRPLSIWPMLPLRP